MAPWALAIFRFVNVGMFRLFGRRMRTTLGWFPDDEGGLESRLVVASAAGAAAHPAWYVNLARRPDGAAIDVDGHHYPVNADSLRGPERDRAWARIVALAPGYGKYEQQTDREIPVVRLTRKS